MDDTRIAVDVRPAYHYDPGSITTWYYVTGIMSIIMFINASLVASALAVKEKEPGTIEQLMMTPAQTVEMLLAKTSPVFVLMMFVLFIALVTSIVVFGLPFRGALWLFMAARASAELAGIGVGVMIATVSKSQQQAQLLTFFVNRVFTLLSGATSPIDNMPDFFQRLSVSGSLTLSGHDHPRCDIKERAMQRTLAEPRCAGGVRHRFVLHQRVALPKAVSGV